MADRDKINIFWFRRDLRLFDNCGLFHSLKSGLPVLPLFIFDTNILSQLNNRRDARVTFIHSALEKINAELHKYDSSLSVYHGKPEEIIPKLGATNQVHAIFANHDYEPYARNRDEKIRIMLRKKGVEFITFKDQAIFEKDEIMNLTGRPYTVFTPFSKKWKEKFSGQKIDEFPSENHLRNLLPHPYTPIPTLQEIGFQKSLLEFPPEAPDENIIRHYHQTRDYPAMEQGTSRLGPHLRFGTISIRELAQIADKLNQTFLNELIWREFFMQILWHFPHVEKHSFRPIYDRIQWRNDEAEFDKWCRGLTGYPLVDAGMRQLNETGFMHNRVRMVTASFLCKHLLIDWRWGEAYFASKLLDYELSSNNGNWQWAAGSGCDAAPYFRIFNPEAQAQKFDPEKKYIQKWLPEYGMDKYPKPLEEHEVARERCLAVFKKALNH